jgi:nitric oxide dioxygenase/hemoglobin
MRTASEQAKAIVKATAPVIEKHGLAITTAMYARPVPQCGSRRDVRPGRAGKRRTAAPAGQGDPCLCPEHRQLGNLGPAVQRMVARHVETGVKAEHYPLVAEALLPAIRDVVGADVATDEVLAAWGEAYWMLADILIAAEAQAYEEASAA